MLRMHEFLDLKGTIYDVRSPGEYVQGHIPGAVNIPLFSDEERAQVGTAYKTQSPKIAIQLGWDIVTTKIENFLETIEQTLGDGVAKIHCRRGGMRSQAFAELFRLAGIETLVLQGGYKTYRNWCNTLFSRQANYRILGGLTGAGKTKILHSLKKMGEQVIDLEELANHRGSVFGMHESIKQPTTEQFHNTIANILSACDPKKPIWIEDESRLIGTCHLPEELFNKMRLAPLVFVEKPLKQRLMNINSDYGAVDPEYFISGVNKIAKKLGGSRTKTIIEDLRTGNLKEAATAVLHYYDAAYTHDLSRRSQNIQHFQADSLSCDEIAAQLIEQAFCR